MGVRLLHGLDVICLVFCYIVLDLMFSWRWVCGNSLVVVCMVLWFVIVCCRFGLIRDFGIG